MPKQSKVIQREDLEREGEEKAWQLFCKKERGECGGTQSANVLEQEIGIWKRSTWAKKICQFRRRFYEEKEAQEAKEEMERKQAGFPLDISIFNYFLTSI